MPFQVAPCALPSTAEPFRCPPNDEADRADTNYVDAVLLVIVFLASAALAVAGARGALAVIFHMMANPVSIRWGRVVFAAAVFWFWYLVPAVADTLPLATVKSLFVP